MSRMSPGKTFRHRTATSPSVAATSMRQHTQVSPGSSLTAWSTRLPRSPIRARYESGLVLALARVDPADYTVPSAPTARPSKECDDRPIVVDPQRALEASAAVERARELQIGGEEHARWLWLQRCPRDVDLAPWTRSASPGDWCSDSAESPSGLTRTGLLRSGPGGRHRRCRRARLGDPGHQRLGRRCATVTAGADRWTSCPLPA